MPDAEEMISLPDQVKKGPQGHQDDLRLHYFPDIPVDESPDVSCSQSGDSGFQRIFFKSTERKRDCSDEPFTTDSDETADKENTPSIDKIKTNAFQEAKLSPKNGEEALSVLIETKFLTECRVKAGNREVDGYKCFTPPDQADNPDKSDN